MPGLLRLRRGHRLFFHRSGRYGFDLYHAALRNHIPRPVTAREMVIGPLEFGFGEQDGLVAVAECHEIMVCATAKDGQTEQECQSQSPFDSGRAHCRAFFVHEIRGYTVTAALAMFSKALPTSPYAVRHGRHRPPVVPGSRLVIQAVIQVTSPGDPPVSGWSRRHGSSFDITIPAS
jgi:hypothetical protein